MSNSPRLGAPQVADASTTPGTDCNEQCAWLDQGAGSFAFKDRDATAPPGSPAEGDCYLVAGSPTGGWTGHAGDIAFYLNGAWEFIEAKEGMVAWISDEDIFVGFTGATWTAIGSSALRLIAFFATTAPTASEVLCLYVAADAFTIPANLSGTQVKVGTNPAATFAIDVQKNGSTIATISISTGGVVTLTTSGGTSKAIAVGDVVKFVAPGSADANIANLAVNVKGTL